MSSIVEEKSFDFSVRIVKLSQYLTETKNEFIMSRQLLKSGTSIGANVAEAKNAQSNNDFISKFSIALKEVSETKYWLRLLFATQFINQTEFESVFADCTELEKIISSIILTSKGKE